MSAQGSYPRYLWTTAENGGHVLRIVSPSFWKRLDFGTQASTVTDLVLGQGPKKRHAKRVQSRVKPSSLPRYSLQAMQERTHIDQIAKGEPGRQARSGGLEERRRGVEVPDLPGGLKNSTATKKPVRKTALWKVRGMGTSFPLPVPAGGPQPRGRDTAADARGGGARTGPRGLETPRCPTRARLSSAAPCM